MVEVVLHLDKGPPGTHPAMLRTTPLIFGGGSPWNARGLTWVSMQVKHMPLPLKKLSHTNNSYFYQKKKLDTKLERVQRIEYLLCMQLTQVQSATFHMFPQGLPGVISKCSAKVYPWILQDVGPNPQKHTAGNLLNLRFRVNKYSSYSSHLIWNMRKNDPRI